jgi:molybdopterin converting factor small subunit
MLHANFAKIDSNKIATAKQVYGVACHFANIHAKSPSERYGLTKVFNAVLNKFYGDQDSHMTHGDVTDFREHQVVPKEILKLIKKPKAAKKVKAKPVAKAKQQTVQQAEEVLDSKKPKAVKKTATAQNSVAKKMDNRITALETKVSDIDSKLDAMLEILQASK